jgi:hypothetical protein
MRVLHVVLAALFASMLMLAQDHALSEEPACAIPLLSVPGQPDTDFKIQRIPVQPDLDAMSIRTPMPPCGQSSPRASIAGKFPVFPNLQLKKPLTLRQRWGPINSNPK